MIRVLVVFHSLYWIQGAAGVNDVTQSNAFLVEMGKSATIDCSHTKGLAYDQMYWFRQYHGESMELIVYTTSYGTKDFGKFKQSKFSANQTVAQSGSFTVNDVDYSDSAVYFCAVSKHSVITTGQSCTKTQCVFVRRKNK
ncbi:immunoglobulin iota chain-like [Clarias magur]|nr:immunoglobulin iota chain-like [Clarias magur]